MKIAKLHSILVGYSANVKVALDEGKAVISNIREDQKERIEKNVLAVDGITNVSFQEPYAQKTPHINPFHNI